MSRHVIKSKRPRPACGTDLALYKSKGTEAQQQCKYEGDLDMKTLIAAILMIGSVSHAGLSGFDTDKFNDVIVESMYEQNALRDQLRKDAGFKAPEAEVRESKIVELGTKTVNVPTQMFKQNSKKKTTDPSLKNTNSDIERVSQELNELN